MCVVLDTHSTASGERAAGRGSSVIVWRGVVSDTHSTASGECAAGRGSSVIVWRGVVGRR